MAAAQQGEELSGRFMQCFLYTRAPGLANDHFYAHPLDMVVNLDMNTQKVRPHPSQTRPFLSTLAPHQCQCSRKGDWAQSTTPASAQLRPCLLDIRPAAGALPCRNDCQHLSATVLGEVHALALECCIERSCCCEEFVADGGRLC